MKAAISGTIVSLGMIFASIAGAQTLKLTPANPQPSGLKSGLSVKYSWLGTPPMKHPNIESAISHVKGIGKPGKPLRGLDYRDTNVGDPVLTHKEHYNVTADIRGFIRFDQPGTYELETWSNDGIDAKISGKSIGYFAGRQGCEPNQRVTVQVPEAGWYPLHVYYFQKYGTACLMMRWAPKGSGMQWVPNNVFGRK